MLTTSIIRIILHGRPIPNALFLKYKRDLTTKFIFSIKRFRFRYAFHNPKSRQQENVFPTLLAWNSQKSIGRESC